MSKDTTHTVRYEQPSALSALPLNKVAQFMLGCVIILVAWKAWWGGWFSMFAFERMDRPLPSDGMGSPIGLIPFAIDAVCLVGIAGFALISMIRGTIGPLFGGLSQWMAEAAANHSAAAAAEKSAEDSPDAAVVTPQIDAEKLAAELQKISDRLAALEKPTPKTTRRTRSRK